MKKQIFGFKCAFRGIWNTVKSESHMRFHIVAGIYVMIFSFFYSFSPAQYALLILLIALIMALETINTCVEDLCGLVADRYEPLVKFVKDAAAGAVLIAAVGAVAVACLFFLDFDVISKIICFFTENLLYLALFLISAVISAIFVVLGPVGIKEKILKIKNRNSKKG
ncbi:MAG: diacylglycerol kinase family protein [Ruminococcus sp.]